MVMQELPTTEPAATPAARAKRKRRGPLAWGVRGFRDLTAVWVFTNLGDSALYLMIAVWVKDLTGSDAAAAVVFIALGLPALVAPFLGVLADRFSRKRLLVIANAAMVPIVLALVFVGSAAQLWVVYAVVVVYGAVGYLTAAAQSGLIRDLLDDEHLASGNGFLTTIDQGFRLLSPLIGTGLYVFIGPLAVVGLTATCFGIAALLMLKVHVVESQHEPSDEASRSWHQLVAGFTHLARTPVLNRITLAMVIGFAAVGLMNVIVFPALERGLGVDTATLGLLVPLQGIGAVIGGILSSTIITKLGEGRAVGIGMFIMAIGCLPAAGTSVVMFAAGMLLVGFSIPIIVVGFATLRQRSTPSSLQGRTSAAGNVLINVPQTLAMIGAAAIIAAVDYRWLVIVTVIAVAGAGVVAVVGRRPVVSTS